MASAQFGNLLQSQRYHLPQLIKLFCSTLDNTRYLQKKNSGHHRSGVGSIMHLQPIHHKFIYNRYKVNPSLPLDAYCYYLYQEFKIQISVSTLHRWFKRIGKFKGNLRVTSTRPTSLETWVNTYKLQRYLNFIKLVKNKKRLVFSDEKPMKGIDIYRFC